MRPRLLLLGAVSTASASVLSRAVPINFWLLHEHSSAGAAAEHAEDVRLCAACCASADADSLERSLRALAARRSVAVEIAPLRSTAGPAPVQWSEAELAEEVTAEGPRSFLLPGGRLVRVDELSYDEGGSGHLVWDAAVGMSIWLTQHAELVRGRSVLELGAGVGLSGICAAVNGARATLSDVFVSGEERLAGGSAAPCSTAALRPRLEANAALNNLDTARTLSLDWADCLADDFAPSETYPVVIATDCVYDEFGVGALAAAVVAHTAPGGLALLMSARGRPGAEQLPPLLEAAGVLETEGLTVHNSYGRTELVLSTFRKHG